MYFLPDIWVNEKLPGWTGKFHLAGKTGDSHVATHYDEGHSVLEKKDRPRKLQASQSWSTGSIRASCQCHFKPNSQIQCLEGRKCDLVRMNSMHYLRIQELDTRATWQESGPLRVSPGQRITVFWMMQSHVQTWHHGEPQTFTELIRSTSFRCTGCLYLFKKCPLHVQIVWHPWKKGAGWRG